MTARRVLVFGGRDYNVSNVVYETLDRLNEQSRISCVVTGCATGADAIAENWAIGEGIDVDRYPADWKLGRKAGPLRNQRMIDEGKPDFAVAFPGGRGTADMLRRVKAARIPFVEVGA
jgi:predicted Rossmann-fold nucleotide-binding protein